MGNDSDSEHDTHDETNEDTKVVKENNDKSGDISNIGDTRLSFAKCIDVYRDENGDVVDPTTKNESDFDVEYYVVFDLCITGDSDLCNRRYIQLSEYLEVAVDYYNCQQNLMCTSCASCPDNEYERFELSGSHDMEHCMDWLTDTSNPECS